MENNELETSKIEERLVSVCRQLVNRRWQLQESVPVINNEMNLLHLAAALGLLRVICTCLNWRLENSSPLLEKEINPQACDSYGYTPLVDLLLFSKEFVCVQVLFLLIVFFFF